MPPTDDHALLVYLRYHTATVTLHAFIKPAFAKPRRYHAAASRGGKTPGPLFLYVHARRNGTRCSIIGLSALTFAAWTD